MLSYHILRPRLTVDPSNYAVGKLYVTSSLEERRLPSANQPYRCGVYVSHALPKPISGTPYPHVRWKSLHACADATALATNHFTCDAAHGICRDTASAHREDDSLVQDKAAAEAAAHTVERYIVSVVHAGQIDVRTRLADHA